MLATFHEQRWHFVPSPAVHADPDLMLPKIPEYLAIDSIRPSCL
jgi:hypothetical protein